MEARDQVVSLMYEAAVNPSLWPSALATFADAAKSVELTLALYAKIPDSASSGAVARLLLVSGRMWEQSDAKPYLDHYSKVDPLVRATIQSSEGDLRLCHECISDEDVAHSEYYQDLLLPKGGRYIAFWKPEDNAQRCISLALHRRRARFERGELAGWGTVADHARHAVSLAGALGPRLAEGDLLRQAIDHQGMACIMVDANARVIDGSAAAIRLLETGSTLKLRGARQLATNSASETKELRSLIWRTAAGRSAGMMRVADGAQGGYWVLQIVPTGVARDNPFDPRFANCALVFLNTPRRPIRPNWNNIRMALDCTQAEAVVAADLAGGMTPAEIAATRKVSIHTVRSQVRALLTLTGLHRIAQLVSYLARIGSPKNFKTRDV